MNKFLIISCHVLWRELCHFASISKNTFDFNFIEQSLHNTPDILRKKLQDAIDKAEDDYSAIFVGYGLCGNGLEGIVARKTKLVVMRGHDCITFLLGSKERYKEYLEKHPGTYWYSPGWIDTDTQPSKERYEQVLQTYIEKYGKDNAEYLMEAEQGWFKRYSNAAYVDLGFYTTEEYKTYTKKCSKWLGWNNDFLSGSPKLIKDFLEGNWNSEEFLVVQPGEMIVASHDDKIIHVRK
ncbi:MAG: DUF1638 domain-containing protein [Elusimicrobia bacterium]|nr:DUF1638 domain-containing protein [Elusimicrobiota bacterium]